MRAIFLPAHHRWITIPQYIAIVKRAKENPDREFSGTLETWWPGTGKDILQQFLAGVHDRINQGIPCSQRGVK